jgi:hypothetical protein
MCPIESVDLVPPPWIEPGRARVAHQLPKLARLPDFRHGGSKWAEGGGSPLPAALRRLRVEPDRTLSKTTRSVRGAVTLLHTEADFR